MCTEVACLSEKFDVRVLDYVGSLYSGVLQYYNIAPFFDLFVCYV